MLFKKLRIIFLCLLFFSLFVSCENSISYDDEEIQSSITSEEVNTPAPVKYASINGFYQNYGGALPAGIQKAIAEINTARPDIKNRSAYPGLNTTLNEIQYYVTAMAENEKAVSGSVSVENNSYSVTGLKFGIDWTVEVGIKVKQTKEGETENWIRCFYDVSEPVRITESNMAVSRKLILKPDTSGYGSVELNLTTDSSITGLEIKLDNEEQRTKWQAAFEADDEKEISPSKIKLANLQSGQYDLTLLFSRSGESYPCYSTTQTIVVIKGMTTDTWQSNGTSLISATGEFSLTSALISNYVDSCIYVGQNSAASSIGVSANNSNEGRAYSPLASVNEAVKRIRNANVSRDYKIFVSGSREENIKIGGEGDYALPATAASSITIQGLNNNSEDSYTDIISGASSSETTISITSAIPLTFKNIKIKTAGDSEFCNIKQGGGIIINNSDANVTLDKGAWVGNCMIKPTEAVSSYGAGIYITDGTLRIKNGARITNNQTSANGQAFTYGAGVYLHNGTIIMDGGTISNNTSVNGKGSGVYIEDGSIFVSGSSLIENNFASLEGGAIYFSSGNFSLSGSFYIPYGVSENGNLVKGPGKNDIYLESTPINLSGPLYLKAGTTEPMATITAPNIRRGLVVVQIDSASTITSIIPYKDYFALSASDWSLEPSRSGTQLIADSPIYVAGANHKKCTTDGSADGEGTKVSPVSSISKALNIINNNNIDIPFDYVILIDGTIGPDVIEQTYTNEKINSLTIKGANSFTSDADRVDIIDTAGHEDNAALNISGVADSAASTTFPVIIENLKITNSSATPVSSYGINIGTNRELILGNDVLVTGHYGYGISLASSSTLKVKGNVEVYRNYSGTSSETPLNIKLPTGKTIEVIGPLKKGSGTSAKKAKIGVTTTTAPAVGSPVQITSGYGYNSGGYNVGVIPGTYFFGDAAVVADDSISGGKSAGEAVVAINGGGISFAPIYENITIEIDKTEVSAADTLWQFRFTATAEDALGNRVTIDAGNEEDQISYSYIVSYYNEDIPEGTYYTAGIDSVTFSDALPPGQYLITVQAVYNGRNYSAGFDVRILEN